MQWRAWEAWAIDGLTQAKVAAKFGRSRSAIAKRIERYRRRTIARYGNALARGGRKIRIRPIQLSLVENQ